MKIPMLESLFKETPTNLFFCKCCEIFKNTYFEDHLQIDTVTIFNMDMAIYFDFYFPSVA